MILNKFWNLLGKDPPHRRLVETFTIYASSNSHNFTAKAINTLEKYYYDAPRLYAPLLVAIDYFITLVFAI